MTLIKLDSGKTEPYMTMLQKCIKLKEEVIENLFKKERISKKL